MLGLNQEITTCKEHPTSKALVSVFFLQNAVCSLCVSRPCITMARLLVAKVPSQTPALPAKFKTVTSLPLTHPKQA